MTSKAFTFMLVLSAVGGLTQNSCRQTTSQLGFDGSQGSAINLLLTLDQSESGFLMASSLNSLYALHQISSLKFIAKKGQHEKISAETFVIDKPDFNIAVKLKKDNAATTISAHGSGALGAIFAVQGDAASQTPPSQTPTPQASTTPAPVFGPFGEPSIPGSQAATQTAEEKFRLACEAYGFVKVPLGCYCEDTIASTSRDLIEKCKITTSCLEGHYDEFKLCCPTYAVMNDGSTTVRTCQ